MNALQSIQRHNKIDVFFLQFNLEQSQLLYSGGGQDMHRSRFRGYPQIQMTPLERSKPEVVVDLIGEKV